MEIIGIIISILALGLSLFTYFSHDYKIKEQQKLINRYNLEKITKEKEEDKKAIIEANVIRHEKGKRVVKVYNKGKATARNTVITVPESERDKVLNNPSPIDIRPQNSVDLNMYIVHGSSEKIDLTFEWQDDFKENNEDKQSIQLL